VLGTWSPEEEKGLIMRIGEATELVKSFVFAGAANTMNKFNGPMPS
jgi:PTH1 family peptidyl-tRNA hydrolase